MLVSCHAGCQIFKKGYLTFMLWACVQEVIDRKRKQAGCAWGGWREWILFTSDWHDEVENNGKFLVRFMNSQRKFCICSILNLWNLEKDDGESPIIATIWCWCCFFDCSLIHLSSPTPCGEKDFAINEVH